MIQAADLTRHIVEFLVSAPGHETPRPSRRSSGGSLSSDAAWFNPASLAAPITACQRIMAADGSPLTVIAIDVRRAVHHVPVACVAVIPLVMAASRSFVLPGDPQRLPRA